MMENAASQLLKYGVNILLVRFGVLVKVTRTYEKDIYPYGTTGPGNGNDADGLQQRRTTRWWWFNQRSGCTIDQ